MQDVCRYWRDGYDWRAQEARLNRFDQFITEIDGLDIHFVHQAIATSRGAAAGHHPRLARIDRRVPQGHRAAVEPHCARR
jgi:hypothetical protein